MEAVRRISFPVEKRDGLGVINTFGFNTNSRGLIPRFSLPPPFLHIRFLIETFSPILPTLPNTRLSQSTFHPLLPSSPSSTPINSHPHRSTNVFLTKKNRNILRYPLFVARENAHPFGEEENNKRNKNPFLKKKETR